MEDEKKDANEEVEEKTTEQDGQPDETKSDDQPEDTGIKDEDQKEEEVVFEKDGKKYTAKDLETLEFKAKDFDGIIEKRRLAKLGKKEEPIVETPEKKETEGEGLGDKETFSKEEVQALVRGEVAKVAANLNTETYNQNLKEAYNGFLEDNPWANSDDAFAKINEHFSTPADISKESLAQSLKLAAQNAFPKEYSAAIEERIKSKVLLEERTIESGDGGGGATYKAEPKTDLAKNATKEDKDIADQFFGGDLEKYMKYKSEKE